MSSVGKRRTDSTIDDGVCYIYERNSEGAVVRESFVVSDYYIDMDEL